MRLVALGDSFTCGEGVGVRVPQPETWSALLAASLGADHTSFAAPGARVRDVLLHQLPETPEADVAVVLIGLNDVARGGFDLERIAGDLLEITSRLKERADVVLVGRLHDPTRMLWFPAPLRRIGQQRVAALNAVIDALPDVELLDTDGVAAWHRTGAWDVDRVHPSRAGHAALAREAGLRLRERGLPVHLGPPVDVPRGRTVVSRGVWASGTGCLTWQGISRSWRLLRGKP